MKQKEKKIKRRHIANSLQEGGKESSQDTSRRCETLRRRRFCVSDLNIQRQLIGTMRNELFVDEAEKTSQLFHLTCPSVHMQFSHIQQYVKPTGLFATQHY